MDSSQSPGADGRPTLGRTLKRLADLAGASLALALTAPLLAAIAAAIRVSMGPPVLFRQVRPGFRGRSFTVLKFRTMRSPSAEEAELATDALRLTPLGRLLRRASLDELPQLWNVLRGEMSFVGPRPLLVEYLDRYTPEQARRHDVPPGITGWAQVNGRNALTWEEKFALDVWYVDHWTLVLDMRILAVTMLSLLRREGISQDGYATMPAFTGTAQESLRG